MSDEEALNFPFQKPNLFSKEREKLSKSIIGDLKGEKDKKKFIGKKMGNKIKILHSKIKYNNNNKFILFFLVKIINFLILIFKMIGIYQLIYIKESFEEEPINSDKLYFIGNTNTNTINNTNYFYQKFYSNNAQILPWYFLSFLIFYVIFLNFILGYISLQNKSKKSINITYTKNNNKMKNGVHLKFNQIIIIKLIILINIFQSIYDNKYRKFETYNFANITLKVKGIGFSNIFSPGDSICPDCYFDSQYFPDEVLINGRKQDIVNYSFYFDKSENTVELKWNNNNINCGYMFRYCTNITDFDFSNFDTSQVEYIQDIFFGLSALTSLNLSNFNMSHVKVMYSMFNGCSSLTSLNLSNFDTSHAENMDALFYFCELLSSLDLSNFNTSRVIHMESMFYFCSSLTSLNLSNFDNSQVLTMKTMFYGCKKLEYINLKNFNEIKLNNDSYSDMFYNVPDNVVICINEYDTLNKIFPQIKNKTCYVIDCSDNWKLKRKKIIKEKNICVDSCNNDTVYKYELNGRCYENCGHSYYFLDNQNEYHCTFNLSCPEEYPFLVKETKECIKKAEIKNVVQDLIDLKKNKNNENETITMAKEEEIEFYDTIIKAIEESFISEDYDTSNIDSGQDEVIETEKMTITFTTTDNQKDTENEKNNNITTIDLGECEDLLREYYNISEEEKLYMKKIDIVQEGMKTKKVEYDVYCKLKGTNLIKLNLTVCSKSKISLSVPIIITENLDKFNSSSGYYNDICYTTTSESGTDIPLSDRKKEFVEGNNTICQEDCDFDDYNYKTSKAKCSCKVKQQSSTSFANMTIDKVKLYQNFVNIKNIANVKILECHKSLFTKNSIKSNIGCFLISFIVIFHIIVIFSVSITSSCPPSILDVS